METPYKSKERLTYRQIKADLLPPVKKIRAIFKHYAVRINIMFIRGYHTNNQTNLDLWKPALWNVK